MNHDIERAQHPALQARVRATLAERERSGKTVEALQHPDPALLHGSDYVPPKLPTPEELAKTLAGHLRPVPRRRV